MKHLKRCGWPSRHTDEPRLSSADAVGSEDAPLRPSPFAFRPRLFWLMLGVFGLVIVLGVGGMVTFFGIATAGIWSEAAPDAPPAPPMVPGMRQPAASYMTPQEWARLIAQRYEAEGGSWQGVEGSLPEPPAWMGYVLADERGVVVVSNQPRYSRGERITERELRRGTPVFARGARVGTLLSIPSSPFAERVMRGLLGAGLGLAAVLLMLAAVFSSRISRPLHRLTRAAESVAAGDLAVRVQGARIRELDTLAGSFNRMADSLVAADKQRRQLTADVAHELRTPLTIIKGQLEGIQDGVYEPSPERVAGLLEKTDLLERLIEDLRLLALSEAGQLQLFPESVEAEQLLEEAAESFAAQAYERGVALDICVEPGLPELQADPQRIEQVLTNLVGNALRYTQPGGAVTLRAFVSPEQLAAERAARVTLLSTVGKEQPPAVARRSSLVIEVADTGEGIPAEDLPHIFDRFWRADRSRTRSSGGTGLGLAIARQIVEAHGGRMWATSVVGQGTTVSFTLPLQV
jgi:two-component system OmpR family sensor kinase/two-component system sensor histidine kinase BaeS